MGSLRQYFAQFGPGLLYAGAAVGVSHLVQSTRAGAEFGFQLLAVVIIVNVLKYPVFETGARYAAATGKSLLDGYLRIGKWAVVVYVIMSVLTMFIIMSAISIVTAGLSTQLLEISVQPRVLAVVLLVLATIILGLGHYSVLDRTMKFIIILLAISTLAALILAALDTVEKDPNFMTVFDWGDSADILFLVALIGWMPAPIDISVWHSVWSVSKFKERGSRASMPIALRDFKVGYWGTTLLACCFLSLGALVMYATGITLADSGVGFSDQLVSMYTSSIGQWAFPLIAVAAFTTMFSTLLTCFDAFPRTLRLSSKLLIQGLNNRKSHIKIYWFWLITTGVGTSVILLFFLSDMRQMVDLATTISFVVAPILATLNFIAINDKAEVAPEHREPKWLKVFNLISIALLYSFSIWFLI